MLWTIRVKGLGRVEERLVQASTEDLARQVGEAWAAQQGYRVVGVVQAVVADESILAPAPPKQDGAARPAARPIQ